MLQCPHAAIIVKHHLDMRDPLRMHEILLLQTVGMAQLQERRSWLRVAVRGIIVSSIKGSRHESAELHKPIVLALLSAETHQP
eukprot:CAMPEP_0179149910 /NCGR_PEP_ID=MMETSP0796-20121207/72661_1 /TAXON_ID=73915 /ORGANISM="Pyrodinium bahamense, Strain pbaha01" /LENGTH=82 /DNA_ID=CAMNT_0020850811 /DNA_START=12 /DNA_END=260 /DNA_ORIENTATION=-